MDSRLPILLSCALATATPVAARGTRHDAWPTALRVSSGFGSRADPFLGSVEVHRGVDLAGPLGTPILAAATGVVRFAGTRGGYGYFVEVEHSDGSRTRYGHLSRVLVAVGEPVGQGAVLGLMGSTGHSTGSHLHFEYLVGGIPVDPLRYLATASVGVPFMSRLKSPAVTVADATPVYRSAFSRARDARASERESQGLPDGVQAASVAGPAP